MHVSTAAITESPKGTMYWKEEEEREGGGEEGRKRGLMVASFPY